MVLSSEEEKVVHPARILVRSKRVWMWGMREVKNFSAFWPVITRNMGFHEMEMV